MIEKGQQYGETHGMQYGTLGKFDPFTTAVSKGKVGEGQGRVELWWNTWDSREAWFAHH